MNIISSRVRDRARYSIKRFVLLALILGFCCLVLSQTAEAQFFNLPSAPQIGSVPPPNAGVWAQNQGYFMQDWTRAGRVSAPVSSSPASPSGGPFNPPPWGGYGR
jgi:hypothetical protein